MLAPQWIDAVRGMQILISQNVHWQTSRGNSSSVEQYQAVTKTRRQCNFMKNNDHSVTRVSTSPQNFHHLQLMVGVKGCNGLIREQRASSDGQSTREQNARKLAARQCVNDAFAQMRGIGVVQCVAN